MGIELTILELVLGGTLAFLAGLFGLLFYYERRSDPKPPQDGQQTAHLERLEQYESQLVGLKVRLDALSLGVLEPVAAAEAGREDTAGAEGGATPEGQETTKGPAEAAAIAKQPAIAPSDITNHILHLITSKSMTARDIQITIKRTREHTSRLMKRLADEGLVQRHSGSRPYTYSITQQGRERLARGVDAPQR